MYIFFYRKKNIFKIMDALLTAAWLLDESNITPGTPEAIEKSTDTPSESDSLKPDEALTATSDHDYHVRNFQQ